MIAIEHAGVVRPDVGRIDPDQTVVVDGRRITWIGAASAARVPQDATRIDGRGKFVMPGLADMHAHPASERDLLMLLAHGVTMVRNMAGGRRHLEWRQRIGRGELVGPRLWTVSPIVDGKPTMRPNSIPVESEEEAETAIARLARAGYSAIKIYDHLSRAGYDHVFAAAKRDSIPVVGHVPFRVPLERVFAVGQRSIEHGYAYIEALLPEGAPLRRGDVEPSRGRGLLAEGLVRQVEWDRLDDVVEGTVKAGIWNCFTLMIRERHTRTLDDLMSRPWIKYESPITIERWRQFKLNYPFDVGYKKDELEFFHRLLVALHAAGAGILLGTDCPVPFIGMGSSLHDELAETVAAGLTPAQALTLATAGAARFLGEDDLGTVAVGKGADLVMLDADPLADIHNTTHIRGVMAGGNWYTPEDLLGRIKRSDVDPVLAASEVPDDASFRARVEWQGWTLGDEVVSRTAGRLRSFGRITAYKNEGLTGAGVNRVLRSQIDIEPDGSVARAEHTSESIDGSDRFVLTRTGSRVVASWEMPGDDRGERTFEVPPSTLLGRATTPLYMELAARAATLDLGDVIEIDLLGPGLPPDAAIDITRYRLERRPDVNGIRRYRFEATRPNQSYGGTITARGAELEGVEFESRASELARAPLAAGRPVAPPVIVKRVSVR